MLQLGGPRSGGWLRSVRLHRGSRDGLRAREQLERALAAVDWALPELPPDAVLMVRRLVAAAPEGSRFSSGVSGALRTHARTARRPWTEADAHAAEAVWFADENELVACLVSDCLGGTAGSRWWWDPVLAGAPVERWLREHVLLRGERVAPMLEHLASRDLAHEWVSRITAADADRAAQAVTRAYAVPAAPLGPRNGVATSRADPPHAGDGARSRIDGPVRDHAASPLLRRVPELARRALEPQQARLLVLARVAAREPAWLRTAEFAQELTAWFEAAVRSAAHDVGHPAAGFVASSERHADPAVPAKRLMQRLKPLVPPESADPDRARVGIAGKARREPGPMAPAEATARSTGDAGRACRTGDLTVAPVPEAALSLSVPGSGPPRREAAEVGHADAGTVPDRRIIRTRFGGLFYLLNAALAMGLYGDFTSPRSPGLALSPWDWLALVARRWFGDDAVQDPLWELLHDVAGHRDGEPPGAGFAAPPQWRLGDEWLAPWGAVERVRYRATAGRLRIGHPEGFLIFDVARDARLKPMAQAAALCGSCARLAGASLERGPVLAPKARPGCVAGWIAWLLPYLQARLVRALDDTGDSGDTGDAGHVASMPALVCRQSARVSASISRVDVHLQLAELPLPIRLAGLDRDPGWIPAAGRAVYFHFD